MNEFEIIKQITDGFVKSPHQKNKVFTSDAEIIEIGGKFYGISIDEFSEEEDLFKSDNLENLGWNLAVCTLSDLFASGVIPRFYMHSVVLPKNEKEKFIERIVPGIKKALEKSGCFLIGGDTGMSDNWRYTGVAIGEVEKSPITRILPKKKQKLWITGKLGDANIAVLNNAITPKFELRIKEAEFIRNYATGAIDTSGGFMDGLWMLHKVNPDKRFAIISNNIPFAEEAYNLGIKKEAVLFGGAGEYELLFTTEEDISLDIDAAYIGDVYPSSETGIYVDNKYIKKPRPDPREARNLEEYIKSIINMVEEIYG